jgi:hypothetical protein
MPQGFASLLLQEGKGRPDVRSSPADLHLSLADTLSLTQKKGSARGSVHWSGYDTTALDITYYKAVRVRGASIHSLEYRHTNAAERCENVAPRFGQT